MCDLLDLWSGCRDTNPGPSFPELARPAEQLLDLTARRAHLTELLFMRIDRDRGARSLVRIDSDHHLHHALLEIAGSYGAVFRATRSDRCCTELSRWSCPNGGNWRYSRTWGGTADQSYVSVTVVRDGPVASMS